MSAVLGFNAYIHDTAAAILVDGRLAAFAEEERFVREKHTTAFPEHAIAFCLAQCGLRIGDVDDVAFYWDPFAGFGERILQTLRNLPGSALQLFRMQLGNFSRIRNVEREFRRRCGFRGRFHHVNQYLGHAAGAFYPSPFDDASVLIVDGNGEIATTWLGEGEGTRLREHDTVLYPHSLGLLYCTLTEYLGFRQNCDEGKVMGLSAYGTDRFLDAFRRIVNVREDGAFRLDMSYFDYDRARRNWFSPKFAREFGPPRRRGEELTQQHMDVAFAGQKVLEDSVIAIVRALVRRTGRRRLAFSGGVALNCVLNGRLLAEGIVDELYVPPPAYDAGAAWGAALYVYHSLHAGAARDRVPTPFLGPGYRDEDLHAALNTTALAFETPDDIAARAAEYLAAGRIVARFSGRMEMGPRALGHRCILADPRPTGMKDHLNARVKHREAFRPFGPSVLAERADELFETGGRPAPYMLVTCRVRDAWRDRIPAIVHVDGTARIQTVDAVDDPDYHALISAFDRATGVPCVLNTSFNVMGEPIVNTPRQAIDCFRSTGIDVLLLGPYLVLKEN